MAIGRWILPTLFAAASACTTSRLMPTRGPDPRIITEEEIDASSGTTAYEVIHALRPNFLTYRGETSFDKRTSRPYPNVYVDDQEYGSIGVLHYIPASDLASVRLYRSWEATTKFGNGNLGGVIAIVTRH